MPAGRPPKYNKGYVTKTKKYLSKCVDEYDEYHATRGEKSDTYQRIVRVRIPTIEGLAVYLHIHKDTINEWDNTYPEFSVVIGELKAKQVEMLIQNGLSGDYNSTIAKVLLAKHGYKEQIGLGGEGEGEPIKIDTDIENAIKRIYGKTNTGS
jgi:hypothetical protein